MRYLIMSALIGLAGCTYETTYEVLPEDNEMNPALERSLRADGWSSSGTLDRLNTSRDVHVQADFAKSKFGTGPYTVELNLDLTKSVAAAGPIRAEAEILWTVEGNFVRRVVSVASGMSVTGVAQAVKVIVRDASPSSFPGTTEYDVSVLVSPGNRSSQSQPPFLQRMGNTFLAAGGNTSVVVPANCGVISVLGMVVTSPVGGAIPLTSVTMTMTQNSVGQSSFYPLIEDWVPLAPGTDGIRIDNNSLFDISFVVVFGIDG